MLLGLQKSIEAAAKGQTVLLFRFKDFHPDLPNILCTLPSIEEMQMVRSLCILTPEEALNIEETLLDKHVMSKYLRQWLLDAPAGIPAFIITAFSLLGYPADVNDVNQALAATRMGHPYYEDLKRLISVSLNTSARDLAGIDFYKLLDLVISGERQLMEMKVMETPVNLVAKDAHKSKNPVPNFATPPTSTINFDEHAQKQREALSK